MRIAYLTTEYPALSHSFIRREIAAMEALGHEVVRFSIRSAGTLRSADDQAEAERTRFILAQGGIALLGATMGILLRRPHHWLGALSCTLQMWRAAGRGLVPHLAWLAEACWLLPILGREQVEHLHAHFGTNPAAVARLVRRLGGPPYSFTVHGPDEFDRPVALDLNGKVAEAQAAVAISDFGRAQLMRWSALSDWPRLHVIRCAVGDEFRTGSPVPLPTAPVLVAVARLAEQKGLPLLIEAAAAVATTHPDLQLRIVGDGPLRPVLERQVRALGLVENVFLVGPLDGTGVRDAMLASRAFVLPSFAEGLPVVLMEALALRRPVIASAIAGTPELVDARCGWLVPAGSVDALATAMRDALDAPAARLDAMGEVGHARVLAMHDARANAGRLADLFGRC